MSSLIPRTPLPKCLAAVGVTLLSVGLVEALSRFVVGIPDPAPVLLLIVACAGFLGGVGGGLSSSMLVLSYCAYFYFSPSRSAGPAGQRFAHLAVLAIVAPLLGLLAGMLRRRLDAAADPTRLKQAEDELRKKDRQLQLLSDTAPVYFAHCDREHRYIFANKFNVGRFGLTPEEVAGRHIADVLGRSAYEAILPYIHRVLAGETLEFELEMPYAVIGRRWIQCRYAPEFGEDGQIRGWVSVILDMSRRKQAEDALQQSEERLRLGLRAGNAGTWDWDILHNKVVWSDQLHEMHGLAPGQFGGTVEDFSRLIHPEDADRVSSAIEAALQGGQSYEIEFRIVRPNGQVRWISTHGRVSFDAGRRPVRMMGVTLDTTQRRQAEEEMERAKAAAEAASRAKDEFLAVLSHELRTPLTPVLLTVSLMESHPNLPADLREDVAAIRRNIELEARLISDLLDLTRVAKGKLQLDLRNADAHLLLRSAADICRRDGSAPVVLDLSATRHHVNGDSARLQQVFWNLISNSQKFTPRDGMITVRTGDAADGRLRIDVVDTGIGVAPELLPRLFDAFEQGDARSARQFGGLGLGLAISKRLVEAHGGTITASSEGKGRGATFSVELPALQSHSPAARAPLPAPPAPPLSAPTSPLRILLVEDHEPTLAALCRLLVRMGHDVATASTAAEARDAAARRSFDLLLSDLGLPDGSGLDLMRQLHQLYAGQGVARGIALTGFGMEQDVLNCRDAGFAAHVTKPVDFSRLEAVIRQVVREQR